MESSFEIKVFTPAGLLLEDKTDSVVLPGANGQVGVLPEHVKYVGQMNIGILEFFSTEEKAAKRMVVSGGFCSFQDGVLTILADSVDFADSIDKDAYATERDELADFINQGHSQDPERIVAREKLLRIEAIDKLISH